MSKHDELRKNVSHAYGKAVTGAPGGACSAGCEPKGTAAKLAGYSTEELGALPQEAVVNSFGCGNPLAFSDVKEGDVVLDLGSGAGIDILIAARKVGPRGRAIGIDMTDEMIAKARENIAASGLANVEVRKGIIEALPVESASVDWVISNCVINLSPEKEKVFGEIARVLKPGGRMRISDIVAQDLPEWVRRDMGLYSSCVAGAISEEEYVLGLRTAGLEEVEVLDRYVYEESQLLEIAGTDLPEGSGDQVRDALLARLGSGCCGDSLAGKIWSAQFSARKPE